MKSRPATRMARRYFSSLAREGNSLRFRFALWGLGVLTVVFIINALLGTIYIRSQLHRGVAALQNQVASSTARRVESIIEQKLARIRNAAGSMSMSQLGGDAQRSVVLSLLENEPAFALLTVIDGAGSEVLKFSGAKLLKDTKLESRRSAPAYLEASRGKPYISPVAFADDRTPYFTFAVPIKDRAQEFYDVLVVNINLYFLPDLLAEIHFGHGGYAYLVDQHAQLIAHPDVTLMQEPRKRIILPKIGALQPNMAAMPSSIETSIGSTEAPVFNSYAPIPSLGWMVVAEEPAQLALAELSTWYRYGAMLLVVNILGGGALILWVSRRFTQPIHELRQAVAIVGHGNLDHRAVVPSNDEIGQLAVEFNKMADILQNSYASLEEKVKHRTSHISALYEVTTVVNQSLDLDRVLQAVVKRIAQFFHFDTTRVYLFDADRRNLVLRAYEDPQPELWGGIQQFASGTSVNC